MKKIYLLLAVGILAATISASAQNVILRMDKNYGVSIDGRNIDDDITMPNLGAGHHTINVYKLSGGILGLGKKRTLVSTSSFELRNNDVTIDVDQYGQLRINEVGNYNTQDRRYDERTNDRTTDRTYDRNSDRSYDRNDRKNGRGYGPYNNPGKGHKYGLYKDKKAKSQKGHKNKGHK